MRAGLLLGLLLACARQPDAALVVAVSGPPGTLTHEIDAELTVAGVGTKSFSFRNPDLSTFALEPAKRLVITFAEGRLGTGALEVHATDAATGVRLGACQSVDIRKERTLDVMLRLDAAGCRTDGGVGPPRGTWRSTSELGAPSGRVAHVAVWTGTEMIVWGGRTADQDVQSGARYDAAADVWKRMSTTGAPMPRNEARAVWTGSEMIVWGGTHSVGFSSNPFADGARYAPATDTWTPMAAAPAALVARNNHGAVWTGTELIVWGGDKAGMRLGDGARYDPAGDAWRMLPASEAPSARVNHTTVWTGTEMIVWGGEAMGAFGDGARYDRVADRWTALPMAGAPSARTRHSAVWTGSEMIVWGGEAPASLDDGWRFDLATGTWSALAPAGLQARGIHGAVWTGAEMLIWGGRYISGNPLDPFALGEVFENDGSGYAPAGARWSPLTIEGAPTGRRSHSTVWTGTEMIVWGGFANAYLSTGARLTP